MKIISALAALVMFFAVGATAQTTNALSEAEIKGRELAWQLCEAQPAENFTNTGVLKIRDSSGTTTDLPVKIEVVISETNWMNTYETLKHVSIHDKTRFIFKMSVKHTGTSNEYLVSFPLISADASWGVTRSYTQWMAIPISLDSRITMPFMMPFANSDFWLCDLGLEFFHWPAQKILPKTTNLKRGREYTLLESTNPNPPSNGYSRVLSWVDKESGGILAAEAYDAQGKLLKEFEPKSFKKVNGQWELQEMEIRNVQTGSRTRLEFDLKK